MTGAPASAAIADQRERVPQYCLAGNTDTAGMLVRNSDEDLTASASDNGSVTLIHGDGR